MTRALISAEEAREITDKYVNPDFDQYIDKIIEKLKTNITKLAKKGKSETSIVVKKIQEDFEEIVDELKNELEDQGYVIVLKDTKKQISLKVTW
jgi:gas vesicle protein